MPDHTKSEIMPTVATVGNWVIRIANASQVEQHWKHKFEQWGGGRDWQVRLIEISIIYFAESQTFSATRKAQEARITPPGRWQIWALVRRDDYDGGILSSCET